MKMLKTDALRRYLVKLGFRLIVFCSVFVFYLRDKPLLSRLVTYEFRPGELDRGVNILHVLWLVFMVMMLRHLFPNGKLTMALKKAQVESYSPVTGFDRTELLEFVQQMNVKAWMVMLVWITWNGLWGMMYLIGWVDNADLLMLTVFYFLCDYICILFWCPFQSGIMKNKCCVNCRIYDWGHFMMFTPMLFIRNFFSWSLFFMSLTVLLHWELVYAKHPERFWEGSNRNLQCAHCKDRTCQIKRKIAGRPLKL